MANRMLTAMSTLQEPCHGSRSALGSCSAAAGRPARPALAITRRAPAIVSGVLRSPGKPLDVGTRELMSAASGFDFSRVRVHADTRSNASRLAVNAAAYTAIYWVPERCMVVGAGAQLRTTDGWPKPSR